MVEYTRERFTSIVEEYGEVFFVLDSGEEYHVHGSSSYDFVRRGGDAFVKTEGLRDGEYLVVELPLDAIEHHYTHREV